MTGQDQTFRIAGEDEGDVASDSLVLPPVKELRAMAGDGKRQNRRDRQRPGKKKP